MSKNKKILFILIVCGLIAIILPSIVLAQTKAITLDNPLGKDITVQTLVGRVISAVLGIVGSIALLMFIYGGFLWLTSSGNEQKITQGKQVLTWATIGLAVIFLSYTLVNFVISGLTTTNKPGGQTSIGICKCTGGGGYQTQNTQSECNAVISTYQPCSWSSQ